MKKNEKIQINRFDTYIAMIKKSTGTKMFQNIYVNNGKDVLENGRLSCAAYASGILVLNGLIKKPHATIKSTIEDMKKSGWLEIDKPKIGAVFIWKVAPWSEGHKHIGFYVGNKKAISNNDKQKIPILHHWTFGQKYKKHKREIESIWWHDALNT